MKWTKTENPRVWEASDGRHYAQAEEIPNYEEGGYVGRIFARPVQMSFFPEGRPSQIEMILWNADLESALRMVIRGFDSEAELPPREEVLP